MDEESENWKIRKSHRVKNSGNVIPAPFGTFYYHGIPEKKDIALCILQDLCYYCLAARCEWKIPLQEVYEVSEKYDIFTSNKSDKWNIYKEVSIQWQNGISHLSGYSFCLIKGSETE